MITVSSVNGSGSVIVSDVPIVVEPDTETDPVYVLVIGGTTGMSIKSLHEAPFHLWSISVSVL